MKKQWEFRNPLNQLPGIQELQSKVTHNINQNFCALAS
jgi:hypothetical protein